MAATATIERGLPARPSAARLGFLPQSPVERARRKFLRCVRAT
jgi:hypothetical protein